MGYLNLKPEQSNLFFKLMEERYSRRSTLLTTNLDYDDWYGFLGKKEMVGALVSLPDRSRPPHFDGLAVVPAFFSLPDSFLKKASSLSFSLANAEPVSWFALTCFSRSETALSSAAYSG